MKGERSDVVPRLTSVDGHVVLGVEGPPVLSAVQPQFQIQGAPVEFERSIEVPDQTQAHTEIVRDVECRRVVLAEGPVRPFVRDPVQLRAGGEPALHPAYGRLQLQCVERVLTVVLAVRRRGALVHLPQVAHQPRRVVEAAHHPVHEAEPLTHQKGLLVLLAEDVQPGLPRLLGEVERHLVIAPPVQVFGDVAHQLPYPGLVGPDRAGGDDVAVQLRVTRPTRRINRCLGVGGSQQRMRPVPHPRLLLRRHTVVEDQLHQAVHLDGVRTVVDPRQRVPVDLSYGAGEPHRVVQGGVQLGEDAAVAEAGEDGAGDRVGREVGAQLEQPQGRGAAGLQVVQGHVPGGGDGSW